MQLVLENVKDDRLRAYFVWLPILRSDNREAALERSMEFSDSRSHHFWDAERITGLAWDKVLNTGQLAWDVYLIYDSSATWKKESPPMPDFWMHQLRGNKETPRLDVSEFESRIREYLIRSK